MMLPTPFEELLRELIKRAKSPDDPIELHEDDIEHLERWLKDGRAKEIYNKICDGKFHRTNALVLIIIALRVRHHAEKADWFNKSKPALEREKKHEAPKARRRALRK